MRISNEQAQQIVNAQGVKGAKPVKGPEAARPTSGSDAVSVSSMGQDIQKALSAFGSLPDVRADRVAELKAQIAGGEYNVSGKDIAESLLRRATDKLL
ncbi:MAG: Anti-sigma-28 factor, FlgM [Cyanobacteria bacterium RYN_339]|nr:Anti-sigma-28 factor, FlgM [Cyanobacteria bacterium RYN_339]